MRFGLDELERPKTKKPARYRITPVEAHPLRMNIDNIAEVIAEVEGDDYK
ncbi:MAG TPA: hypothetical protein VJ901_09595 [Thermoanaerobaculia bacterium]|nr:hypothetical protein [Thermoanaerobaculia bacterium]